MKGQRLDSDIHKLKNEKSAKNGQKCEFFVVHPNSARSALSRKKNFPLVLEYSQGCRYGSPDPDLS